MKISSLPVITARLALILVSLGLFQGEREEERNLCKHWWSVVELYGVTEKSDITALSDEHNPQDIIHLGKYAAATLRPTGRTVSTGRLI